MSNPSSNGSRLARLVSGFFQSSDTFKKAALWLAAPTAMLAFLNQLTDFSGWIFSLGSQSPPAVVEPHDIAATVTGEPARSLTIEAARFDEQVPEKIDVVCRNAAAQPAFIRAAEVELLRVWNLQPVVNSRGLLASSANYALTLPPEGGPTKAEAALSQEIPAKGLDRFSLSVGPSPAKEASAKVYQFRLRLLIGDASLTVGEFLCMSPPGTGAPQPNPKFNRQAIAELGQLGATRNALLAKFLAVAPVE